MIRPETVDRVREGPSADNGTSHPGDMCMVVRAAGERTESLCLERVREHAPGLPVTVLHERPFAAALEKGILHALETRVRWAVFLDADVLLSSQGLSQVASELKASSGDYYMMNFLVLDRGFCGPAYAGIHAFQTSLFRKALRFMPLAYKDQRPETRLCKEMAGLGHPTLLSKTVVALHDYEQYLADLYRKMFVRAIKYRTQLEYMNETFRERYHEHEDYRAMLWGLMDGIYSLHAGSRYASLDAEAYREQSERALRLAGLSEKESIGPGEVPPAEHLLAAYRPGERYSANKHWIAPPQTETRFGRKQPRWASLRRLLSLRRVP